MDAVLYAPGLGYYSAGAQKFGAAGDFVTAPELGPVFARCLARLVGAALAQLGGGVVWKSVAVPAHLPPICCRRCVRSARPVPAA